VNWGIVALVLLLIIAIGTTVGSLIDRSKELEKLGGRQAARRYQIERYFTLSCLGLMFIGKLTHLEALKSLGITGLLAMIFLHTMEVARLVANQRRRRRLAKGSTTPS
jgi:hypothetical protein